MIHGLMNKKKRIINQSVVRRMRFTRYTRQMKIHSIRVGKKRREYLLKRGLREQFEKQCSMILSGDIVSVQLKKRQPKHESVFYFRINRQFRALCRIDEGILTVFFIDNHQ